MAMVKRGDTGTEYESEVIVRDDILKTPGACLLVGVAKEGQEVTIALTRDEEIQVLCDLAAAIAKRIERKPIERKPALQVPAGTACVNPRKKDLCSFLASQ